MIVVTAPTGNIGSRLVAELLDGPVPVRVIVRDPARLPARVRERVEVVQGSHGDAAVVQEAFRGAESLFWLPPGDPACPSAYAAYVEFSMPAAAALDGSGIGRVVAVSALGRGWPRQAGQVTATLQADDLLAQTGVAYRALACGSLMENVLRQLGPIAAQGVMFGPSNADRKGTAVASGDVARCAASLLLDRSWSGFGEVPLKGPEAISANDMAETVSVALGRPVRFQQTGLAELRAALIQRGASPGMADATIELATAKSEGIDEIIAGPTPALTPTTFAAWCDTVLRSAVRGAPPA